jgi:hypothetical protein
VTGSATCEAKLPRPEPRMMASLGSSDVLERIYETAVWALLNISDMRSCKEGIKDETIVRWLKSRVPGY